MKTLIRITLFFSLALGIFLFFLPKHEAKSWGFYGHKKINRMAVFTLPPEMLGFYKKHIEYTFNRTRRNQCIPWYH